MSGPTEDLDDANEDFLSLAVVDTEKSVASASAAYDSMEEMEESSEDEEEDEMWKQKHPRLPPWIQRGEEQRNLHPLTALHNEIVSFLHLMEPLPSEIEQREQLVERIRGTVAKYFGNDAEVQVFGSQATGLFLPTSDIDLVVITKEKDDDEEEQPKDNKSKNKSKKSKEKEEEIGEDYDISSQKSPLHRFAHAIREDYKDELSYLELILNTRIPLVKMTLAATNISVDVCFNQDTGPPAALLMKRYLEALPPLRPLTFVLKYFLAARELNEPYSGGVGSYMLQLMIVAFLQHRERDAKNFNRPSVYNLGSLLLEFLELYGVEMNYYTTGISVRHDGFFFPKGAADRKAVFKGNRGAAMMALENPLDPTQNVGQSSFRYQIIHRAFQVAYRVLLAYITAAPTERELRNAPSILAAILPPTDYMTSRLVLKRRDQPLAAARGGGTKREASGGSSASSKRARKR